MGLTLHLLDRPFVYTLVLSVVVGPPVGLLAGFFRARLAGEVTRRVARDVHRDLARTLDAPVAMAAETRLVLSRLADAATEEQLAADLDLTVVRGARGRTADLDLDHRRRLEDEIAGEVVDQLEVELAGNRPASERVVLRSARSECSRSSCALWM